MFALPPKSTSRERRKEIFCEIVRRSSSLKDEMSIKRGLRLNRARRGPDKEIEDMINGMKRLLWSREFKEE